MKPWLRVAMSAALSTFLVQASVSIGNDSQDKKAAPAGRSTTDLDGEQQKAVGIRVARPVVAKLPERIEALGVVLDATTLVSDNGALLGAVAAEQSAAAELARLRNLYRSGSAASLKMLETAQTDYTQLHGQAELASARLALHWGAVSALSPTTRQKTVQAATDGRGLLLRADLPGHHILTAVPDKAVLDIDGILVRGRILGVLPETTQLQSVGLLIQVPRAPAGLAPGARVPVVLLSGAQSGLLLPREAVLYDENGAYVYKQLSNKTNKSTTSYAIVRVKLLAAYGNGWLTDGVDDDDNIVVYGAGALWSLQAVSGQAPDDDEDED
jgi:hypothetical protein